MYYAKILSSIRYQRSKIIEGTMLMVRHIHYGCKAASSAAHNRGLQSRLQLFRHRYTFSETVGGSAGVSSKCRGFIGVHQRIVCVALTQKRIYGERLWIRNRLTKDCHPRKLTSVHPVIEKCCTFSLTSIRR